MSRRSPSRSRGRGGKARKGRNPHGLRGGDKTKGPRLWYVGGSQF